MSEEIPEVSAESPKIAEVQSDSGKIPPALIANAGRGRLPGRPNRITRDLRRAAQYIVDKRRDRFITWLDRVGRKDPAYACELFIKLLATYSPKPQATSFEAQVGYGAAVLGQPSVLAMRVRQVLEAPIP